MKIFTFQANYNNYQNFILDDEAPADYLKRFDGKSLQNELKTIPVILTSQNSQLPAGDFPALSSHIPVFSKKSLKMLQGTLHKSGELIPLESKNSDEPFSALNVTQIVNALDLEKSTVKRFSSSGRIMRILRHEFDPAKIITDSFFKIPETALKEVYAADQLVNQFIHTDLQGAVFKLVWSDQAEMLLCPYCLGIIEEETTFCPTCGLDTRNDAPFEFLMDDLINMKKVPCPHCATRISDMADPCPFCKQGRKRKRVKENISIVF